MDVYRIPGLSISFYRVNERHISKFSRYLQRPCQMKMSVNALLSGNLEGHEWRSDVLYLKEGRVFFSKNKEGELSLWVSEDALHLYPEASNLNLKYL